MLKQPQENPVLKFGPNSVGQVIYFFGARHTNNPADAQFNHLKQFLTEFINVSGERTILIEGNTGEIPQSYEEASHQYGEAGAVKWLAREANIEVIRPEPSDEKQRKLLCASFSPQLVAYTLIAQNLASWFRNQGQSNFAEAIDKSVRREAKFTDIYGFTPDTIWFKNQHEKLFGKQELEDKNFLNSISDPRRSGMVVNEVVSFRSKIRNEKILSAIDEYWKSGKSIFVVYGKGHLTTLEDKIKELVKDN